MDHTRNVGYSGEKSRRVDKGEESQVNCTVQKLKYFIKAKFFKFRNHTPIQIQEAQ